MFEGQFLDPAETGRSLACQRTHSFFKPFSFVFWQQKCALSTCRSIRLDLNISEMSTGSQQEWIVRPLSFLEVGCLGLNNLATGSCVLFCSHCCNFSSLPGPVESVRVPKTWILSCSITPVQREYFELISLIVLRVFLLQQQYYDQVYKHNNKTF